MLIAQDYSKSFVFQIHTLQGFYGKEENYYPVLCVLIEILENEKTNDFMEIYKWKV